MDGGPRLAALPALCPALLPGVLSRLAVLPSLTPAAGAGPPGRRPRVLAALLLWWLPASLIAAGVVRLSVRAVPPVTSLMRAAGAGGRARLAAPLVLAPRLPGTVLGSLLLSHRRGVAFRVPATSRDERAKQSLSRPDRPHAHQKAGERQCAMSHTHTRTHTHTHQWGLRDLRDLRDLLGLWGLRYLWGLRHLWGPWGL